VRGQGECESSHVCVFRVCSVATQLGARPRLAPPLVAPSIEAVARGLGGWVARGLAGHPAAVLHRTHRLWGAASEAERLW
jgi:hypothetical protein